MARPTLTVCTSCRHGGRLHDTVRALRKERALQELFKVDASDCLGCCDAPCAIELRGKKRSTYTRVGLDPDDERTPEVLARLAVAYAQLAPGEEIPERALPGDSGD